MSTDVNGIILQIDDKVLKNIEKVDEHIRSIEEHSEKAAKGINNMFNQANTHGVIQFANQLARVRAELEAMQTKNINVSLSASDSNVSSDNTTAMTKVVSELAVKMQEMAKMTADMTAQIKASYDATLKRLDAYNARRKEIEEKYQKEIDSITAEHDKKRNQKSVSDAEKAEREKTRKAKDEATARYNEEMRRLRLQNQQATLRNKLTRTAIANAKEADRQAGLENLRKQIEETKAAIASLNKADKDYQQNLERLTRQLTDLQLAEAGVASGRRKLKEESQKLTGVMNQLKNAALAYFSVSAIKGYIMNMVDVRAEMELQHTALRAIIQDKDKADKVFAQVQQLAMQSPFSIMQMTTFTKQLAAYRIETEKLVDTTKMLADVSAGLGVEMGRLILAYGQVKSANYLRATEVRQFTEAGLNIAGELANYFSELQGKMVSVGDVMDMITKRMVRFEDVEEVFKRVTSAGGLFYDMQRKQSETLWGQMQRIKDAMTIMFNDIGKSSQGTLTSIIKGIREMLTHWRTWAKLIEVVVYSFGIYKGTVLLAAFANSSFGKVLTNVQRKLIGQNVAIGSNINSLRMLATSLATVKSALIGLASATIPGLLIAGIGTLIYMFIDAAERAKALNEELENIGSESLKDLNDALANLKRLTDVINDTSKSYSEHNDAVEEMRRMYGDILPKQKLEMDYLIAHRDNYDELTEAIIRYYQAKEYEKKYDAVMASDYYKEMQKTLEDALLRSNKLGDFGMIYPESQVKEWADMVANEISTGKIPKSIEGLNDRFKEIFGKEADFSRLLKESYGSADFTDVIDQVNVLDEKMGSISLSTIGAANAEEAYKRSVETNLETNKSELDSIHKLIEAKQRQIDLTERQYKGVDWEKRGKEKELTDEQKDSIQALEQELKLLQERYDEFEGARAKLIAQKYYEEANKLTDELTKEVRQWWDNERAMKSLERQGLKNSKQYQDLANKQDKVKASADDMAAKYNTEVNWALIKTADTTFELNGHLTELAKKAWPSAAAQARVAMGSTIEYVLKAKGAVLSFFQSIKNLLPEDYQGLLPDFAQSIANNEHELAALRSELGKTEDAIEETKESAESIYSRRAKVNVKKFGADMKAIDNILVQGADTPREMAESLRGSAKAWEETVASYKKSTNKVDWLKWNNETKESINLLEKNAKAANALADEIWNEKDKKKGGKGTDAELKRWQEIKKAIEDANKSYEKYRKYFTEDESAKMIKDEYGKVFDELGIKLDHYYKNGMYDTEALIKALGVLKDETEGAAKGGSEARKKFLNELIRQIETEGVEVKLKAEEKSIEDFKKQIDEMFANYELGKTFTKLGLSIDLTYAVGGKPMTLDDIRAELKSLSALGDKESEERIKVLKDAEKKLADYEHKNQIERIKNYNKYLLESMSERVQIELKAMQETNKIRADETLDEFSKEQAINNTRKKMYDDLAKYDFDKLKSTDVYVTAFKDLEKASKSQLQYVITKLKELQSVNENLSPGQVRAITEQIKKAEEALASMTSVKDLGKNFAEALKFARKRVQLQKEQMSIQGKIDKSNTAIQKAEKTLYDLELKRDSIADKTSKEYEEANEKVKLQQGLVKALKDALNELLGMQENITNEISKGQQSWNNFTGGLKSINENIGALKGAFDDVFNGLDSMGLVSDSFRDTYEALGGIISGLSKALDGLASIDMTKPVSIVTGLVTAIGGIFSAIGGVFGMGDSNKSRKIGKLTKKVEALDKAYQKLEKSIEAAYALDDYNAGYNQMMQNLEEQKAAYEEMIRLEKDKKKTDNDKIKEYEDALEEIADKEEEMRKKRYEMFGSTTDYFSEAENWAKAWLDAYKETGDGLDALKESWDEFFENLVLKQATSAIVSKKMAKYIDMINAAIDNEDPGIDLAQRFSAIGASLKGELAGWNEELKEFFQALGIMGGTGENILSDLQKGIQNITEPQAAAIEAYLNSMRFAMFEQNEILSQMLNAVLAQYGSMDSPILSEVKAIRSILTDIRDNIGRVVRNEIGQGWIVKVG